MNQSNKLISINDLRKNSKIETKCPEVSRFSLTVLATKESYRALLSLIFFLVTFQSFAATPQIRDARVAKDFPSTGIFNGRIRMDIGTKYNGRIALNDVRGLYLWKLTGTDFGDAKGKVSINGVDVPISKWNGKEIIIDPSCDMLSRKPLEMVPGTLKIVVTTSTKQKSTAFNVDFAPAIEGRVYGQCAWFVAKERKAAGLKVYAYAEYSRMHTKWIPARLDAIKWGDASHTALIDSAAYIGMGSYALVITEYNADGKNSFRTYTTITTPSKKIWPVASYNKSLQASGWCR